MYISITGIKVKGFFGMLRFMRYTTPSFAAARKANGNLFCESKKDKQILSHSNCLEE